MKNTQDSETKQNLQDDLLPEYKFDYTKAHPNRFASQVNEIKITVTLEPDVAKVFKPYGMRLKVTIRIKDFNGGQGNLITIWQIDQGKIIPILITNWLEVYS